MSNEKISYHKAADQFLVLQYENNWDTVMYLMYKFSQRLAQEGKKIAKSSLLKEMDYQDAMVSVWFYYVGFTEIAVDYTNERTKLLQEYFNSVAYPEEHRTVVETTLYNITKNKSAENKLQQVVYDAIYSQLGQPDFLENALLLKDEIDSINLANDSGSDCLHYYKELFITTRYYTPYAFENYAAQRERNFQLLEKRIRKTDEAQHSLAQGAQKNCEPAILTNKETEDLFKLAFRNYNHLISVADSKASLLIHVNSIIISVILAFVLGKIEKNADLMWPSVLLLSVSSATIFLAILASRPQKNNLSEDKKGHNFQRFTFGSFDLIDPSFRHVGWDDYLAQLKDYFNSSRDKVYLEVYKETFNVRKALSKKFNYLSIAYWVFIIGLLLSIAGFVVSVQSQNAT